MSIKPEKKDEVVKSTSEIMEAKALEIQERLGVYKVYPLLFIEKGEEIKGYFKEPSRQAKIAIMDKSVMGGYSAVEEILPTVIIKEESDPRILSEKQEHDRIFMGALMAVYDKIKYSTNELKKK